MNQKERKEQEEQKERKPVATTAAARHIYLEDLAESRCDTPGCGEALGDLQLHSACCDSELLEVVFDHGSGELRAVCPLCGALVTRFMLAHRPAGEEPAR